MSFFSRRLDCWYCQKPSKEIWTPGLKSFHCRLCDATNHLDENGEITDPPTPKVSKQVNNRRYAQQISTTRTSSPPLDASSSPFCQTCINNQQLITQALAEYLPPLSDPRYREFERNSAAYKRDLESRYPPVCINCEPRVRAQMQEAGYLAKSDYMKKMLGKTKRMHPVTTGTTRKHVLGMIGLPMWIAAASISMLWGVFALLVVPDDGLRSLDGDKALPQCVQQVFAESQIDAQCLRLAYRWLKTGLILNLLSLWWNPIMLRTTNRANGLGEFYKLQLLLLVSRFAAWHLLVEDTSLDTNTVKAAHALLLALNLALTVVSLSIVRPKIRRAVNFSQDIPPLIEPGVMQPGGTVQQLMPPKPQFGSLSLKSAFPIAKLGTKAPPKPSVLPTPPPDTEYEDLDAMDIDEGPSQATTLYRESFTPNAISTSFKPTSLKSGPAQNTRSGARRNSSRRQGFRSNASNFAASTIADDDTVALSEDGDDPAVTYDQAFVPASMRNRKDYNFASQKLNVENDETGLEGMFKDIFGLRDDPLATLQTVQRDTPANAANPPSRMPQVNTFGAARATKISPEHPVSETKLWKRLPVPVLTFPVLLITSSLMEILGIGGNIHHHLLGSCLAWTASIGSVRLIDALHPRRQFWELSNVLVYLVEAVLSAVLMDFYFQQSQVAAFSPNEHPTSTGPQDPVVAPDTQMLREHETYGALGNSLRNPSDAQHLLTLQQSIILLLGWVAFQEMVLFGVKGNKLAYQLA